MTADTTHTPAPRLLNFAPDPHSTSGRVVRSWAMGEPGLDDGVVRLRDWGDDDAAWYAECVRDPEIQRFTTDPPTLEAEQVLAAIVRMRAADDAEGFLICDAVTGVRLGNIALAHDGRVGSVSYWLAAEARGRGAATRALGLFTGWVFRTVGLAELRLCVHRDNVAAQRVALRAGYRRDPDRDGPQQVKGAQWPMIAFAHPQPTPWVDADPVSRNRPTP